MQTWIFFVPGAGGDGVANLFEHCDEAYPIDNPQWRWDKKWRIQRIVDDAVKFWAPTVDVNQCFRKYGIPFRVENNIINLDYQSAVDQNKKIFVTGHDINLIGLNQSDKKDIFCKNQVKVLLDSRNHHQCYINSKKKNLQDFPSSHLWETDPTTIDDRSIYSQIDRSKFDYVLELEEIHKDFSYVESFLANLGLELDRIYYDQYMALVNGDLTQFTTGIPRYKSYIDDCMVRYFQIDTI